MKKNLIYTIGIMLVALIGLFVSCSKDDKDAIVFAVDSTWPPLEFVNENKEIVGFTIDMVRAIAEKEGFTPKFVTTSWDGIFAGLLNGDYDAISSSVTITDERKEKMNFSLPYFEAGQILAMNKKNAAGISSLKDLATKRPGVKVGAQLGTQGAFLVEDYENIDLKTYDELGPAVEELVQGTIDGIVADTPLVVNYLLKNDSYKDEFVIVGESMTDEEYGIAFKKDNEELLNKINSGLQKIRANGEYDKLIEKWIK